MRYPTSLYCIVSSPKNGPILGLDSDIKTLAYLGTHSNRPSVNSKKTSLLIIRLSGKKIRARVMSS